MKKEFHLRDILSITTGVLFSPDGGEGVSNILTHMVGRETLKYRVFTPGLSEVTESCKESLFTQFPQLKDIDVSGVNKENFNDFLEEQIVKFGEYFEVEQLQ